MNLVDAVLWGLAAALFGAAAWLTVREGERWDPAVFFVAVLGALWRGVPPVREGPVEADGWDGDLDALDPAVQPGARLAPRITWSDVAEGSAPLQAEVARRLDGVRLVWFGPPTVDVPVPEAVSVADATALGEAVDRVLARPETRLVLAAGRDARPMLELLKDAPALRDRLRAVLLAGAELDPAWVAETITHDAYDTELAREVPWLQLRLPGQPALPVPPEPPTARRSVLPVDLGVVAPETLDDPRVGRALALVVAALG